VLVDCRADWKGIGMALHIRIAKLEEIERAHSSDPNNCLTATMIEWLKKNYKTEKFGDPSWRSLVKAVRDFNKDVAVKIAQAHQAHQGSLTHSAGLIERSSPELRVFKLNFSKLVNSIPSSLATEFYSNGLISREVHRAVVGATGLPDSQKVTKLLLAVEDQMVVNPSIFHKFVAVLRADPSLVYIADALSDQYCK